MADTATTTPTTQAKRQRRSMFIGGKNRIALFSVVALQWLFGVVDLGLTAYFMNQWGLGTHTMFDLVVGCISTWCYFLYMWLTFIRGYKGYFLPINLIFSHLWLTAFIFNALDYNTTAGCIAGEPDGVDDCGKKYSLEAMSFGAFFFTLVAIPLDILLYIHEKKSRVYMAHRIPEAPKSNGVLEEDKDEIKAEAAGANAV